MLVQALDASNPEDMTSKLPRLSAFQKNEVKTNLRKVISQGDIVRNDLKPIGNRMGYERVYYYEGEFCIITGIGTSGFIVSAYPHRHRKEK